MFSVYFPLYQEDPEHRHVERGGSLVESVPIVRMVVISTLTGLAILAPGHLLGMQNIERKSQGPDPINCITPGRGSHPIFPLSVKEKTRFTIQSFIQAISIAPLQVYYFSDGYCIRVSRRSATGNFERRLAQGPYVADRAGKLIIGLPQRKSLKNVTASHGSHQRLSTV